MIVFKHGNRSKSFPFNHLKHDKLSAFGGLSVRLVFRVIIIKFLMTGETE